VSPFAREIKNAESFFCSTGVCPSDAFSEQDEMTMKSKKLLQIIY
jgi:hypothetical protein